LDITRRYVGGIGLWINVNKNELKIQNSENSYVPVIRRQFYPLKYNSTNDSLQIRK